MTLPGPEQFTAAGAQPLVLLPVRIETRYAEIGFSLRVRVYPDDIHIDRLDRGISDAEQAAGVSYWLQLGAGHADDAAYTDLIRAVGPGRAAWVATALTPFTAPDGPGLITGAPEPPLFPLTTPRTNPPPTVRAMPDHFVGAAYARGNLVGVGVGSPVSAPLAIGPAAGGRVTATAEGLAVGEGTKWLVDYEAAKAVGMAFEVGLSDNTEPLQLLVFGVRSGDATAELEELLRAHRVTSGVEFIAPGTPTNNTESSRSTWSKRTPPAPPARAASPVLPDSDGARLSAALGIDASVLSPVAGAAEERQSLVAAAHAVLWPASWGNYLAAVGPGVSDELREVMRDTFEDVVRGLGPLPSLRIGAQPYGVLPVVPTGDTAITGVHPGLQRLLTQARTTLRSTDAPTVFTNLLDVLGTSPTMLGVRMRAALPNLDELFSALVVIVDPFGFGPAPYVSPETRMRTAVASQFGLDFGRLDLLGFGSVTRPLLMRTVSDTDADGRYASALGQDQDRDITTILQVLLEVGRETEARALQIATGGADPPAVEGLDDVALAADIQRILSAGDRSQDLLKSAADRLAAKFGYAGLALLEAYQPFSALQSSLLDVADQTRQPRAAAAALQAWCRAKYRIARFDEQMNLLVAETDERRQRVVAEALDCCSHRADAWLTSLATSRLQKMRADSPSGVTVGAYGWVDNLPPPGGSSAPEGGYIHAPSLSQAVSAGVLRSANLAHHGSGAFSIDLSSERVRTALQLLDGVRQGQPVGAVLGYRIERGLRDLGLEQFVLTLRNLAPLAAGVLTGGGSLDGVTRSGVLDGVKLLELPRDGVLAALRQPPGDNPFLTGSWLVPADAPEKISALLDDASSAYDAAADLLVAEGVYQLTSGGTARAAATLDAVGSGALPPPEPEFARTPTSGVPVTHRDLLLLADNSPGSSGWAVDESPRALAEPWLERWAQAALGPATHLEVASGTMLDRAGLSALDVVSAADDPPGLRRLLGIAIPSIAGQPMSDATRRWSEVARVLHRLIAASRPLAPLDLVASGSAAMKTIDDIDLQNRATTAIGRLLEAAQSSDPLIFARFGIDWSDIASAQVTARRRVDAANALRPDWAAAAAAVFGGDFKLLPRLINPPPSAGNPPSELPFLDVNGSQIRRFLLDVATVRDGVARHTDAMLFAGALNPGSSRLRVAQLGRAGGGATAGHAARWVALPFGPDAPPPGRPVTSLVIDSRDDLAGDGALGGLVFDEWLEVVPRQQPLTSGVAVHANAPGARPPQAILVAVSPDNSDWTAQRLATTLAETLDLAKLRAMTLEHSTWLGWVLPALLFPDFSLHNERVIDFKQLAENPLPDIPVPIPFVNDSEGPVHG